MFFLKERSRSRSGEDKIRGLGGWLSYIDKLYRVRKDKPYDRVDKATPLEHYLRSALTGFLSGLLIYGFLVVTIGMPVYLFRFKKIEVTRKLFTVIVVAVVIGSFLMTILIYNYVTSGKVLKWLAKNYGSKDSFFHKKVLDPILKASLEFFCVLGRCKNFVQGIYFGLLAVMIVSYIPVRKIKK